MLGRERSDGHLLAGPGDRRAAAAMARTGACPPGVCVCAPGRRAWKPSPEARRAQVARGNRSSRAIERACVEDVAFRVVAGNLVPGHSTIAGFWGRHEAAPAALFTGV